jgi:hypothetical protein
MCILFFIRHIYVREQEEKIKEGKYGIMTKQFRTHANKNGFIME